MTGFTDLHGMLILFLSMTGLMYGAVILTYDDHQASTEIESITTQPSNHADNGTQYNTNITNPESAEITETIELQNESGETLDSHTETIPPNTTRTVPLTASETQLQNTSTTQVITPTENYATPPQPSDHTNNDTDIHRDATQFEVESIEKRIEQSYYQDSQSFRSNIRNTGDQAGTEPVQLTERNTENGTRDVVDEETVYLEPNETKTVTLTNENPGLNTQVQSVETLTHSKLYQEPVCDADSDALQVGIEETLGGFFGFSNMESNGC